MGCTRRAAPSRGKFSARYCPAVLALWCWAWLLVAPPALAQYGGAAAAADIPFRIDYRGPPECHGAWEFSRQLSARTPRVRPAAAGEPSLTFWVLIAPADRGVLGRFWVAEADGTFSTAREVPGRDCHEVIAAMALIGAILLDPNASTAPLPSGPPPVVGSPPELPPPPEWALGAGVGLLAQSAVAPGLSPGLAIHADWTPWEAAWLAPQVRLALLHVRGRTEKVASGSADFEWWAARLSGCPVSWGVEATFWLRPCLLLEAGELSGQGFATRDPRSASAFWAAVGGLVRAELSLERALVLGLDLGVILPLVDDEFYFDPDRPENVAHSVPRVGFSGQLGVGFRFF